MFIKGVLSTKWKYKQNKKKANPNIYIIQKKRGRKSKYSRIHFDFNMFSGNTNFSASFFFCFVHLFSFFFWHTEQEFLMKKSELKNDVSLFTVKKIVETKDKRTIITQFDLFNGI